jgi:hypothetical protein
MSTDATVAPLLHRRLPALRRLSWSLSTELTTLLALLLVALVFRLVDPRGIEPNLLPDEADHVSTIYSILAGRGPGPFDLSWDGNPAFQLYPAVPFVALGGGSAFGLRVAVAIGSVLMLGAFYAVCRLRCTAMAALAATALLAFSSWALFFSRNGEVNVFVALYALLGAWSVQRALDTGDRRFWLLAGFWAGMGWYGFLAGVLILPCLLAPLPIWLLKRPAERRAILGGVAAMLIVFGITLAPRLPVLIARWDDVQTYISGRAVTEYVPPDRVRDSLIANAATTVRAFAIFDPTLEGNPRYMARGRAVLDAATATLFVIGVVLAWQRMAESALWFSLLILPILTTQIPTIMIPDLARAIIALPAYFLFVGLAVEWAAGLLRPPALAVAVVTVGVAAVCWSNWQGYRSWMASPAAATGAWQAEQMGRAASGQPGLTVSEWREQHPRAPAARARAAMRSGSGLASGPPSLSLATGGGADAPRGVASLPDGTTFLAEPKGRLLRLEPGARTLTPVQPPDALGGGQIWDAVGGPDGFVYLLDSERGLLFKVGPSGELSDTLGADWGMYRPRGLGLGEDGRIYIADTGRNRIVVVDTGGRPIGTIGSSRTGNELEQPTDVAVGPDGRLYVILPELGRLEVLDQDGQRVGGWRIPKGNTIDSPRVAVTTDGLVALTEPQERRVRLFDPEGAILGQIEGGLRMPIGLAIGPNQLIVTDPAAGQMLTYELGGP